MNSLIFPDTKSKVAMDLNDFNTKKLRTNDSTPLELTVESEGPQHDEPSSASFQAADFVIDEPGTSAGNVEMVSSAQRAGVDQRPTSTAHLLNTQIACRFHQTGFCLKGELCEFRHDGFSLSREIPCQYHIRGNCLEGDKCRFSHASLQNKVPVCRFFGTLRGCKNPSCPYGHETETVSVPTGVVGQGEKILNKYSSVKKAEALGAEAAVHRRKYS